MELLIALVGIFLAIVFWLASPKSLRRRLGEYFSGLFRRHPAVTAEAYIDVFDGRVEILTDELLSHPADAARKKEFYEIAPLDWDIIAAHADVERDQQADVIEELTKPVDSLRFVCIHGESGSGKSTLAWRVAAQLHKVHRMLVIRVKDKEEPEVWYRMTEFCRRLRRPVCVLADDLFRHPEVCQALRELNPWLPLAILATSQTNEYPPGRLKGQIVSIHLGPPSFEEKKRVLHRLDQDLEDLTPDQLTRLRAANEFLVLMAELTFGKGFQDVVQDSLDNLLRRYEQMYHAYEYLCFAYSYGVATPASLLERLDAEGRFHDLPNREGAQGLVFCDEKRQELLRPGHQRRAETAQRLFERHRSSATVLRELMSVVEVSSPLERGFFARLLRTLASRKSEALDKALPHIEGMVAQCVQHAERISELTIWQAFYFALERSDEADRCVDYALALEPISSDDCNLLLRLYRKRGREREALPILDRWTQSHPELGGSRPAYLGLVERYSSERDQARVIHDTSAWLASHPDDNYVRRAYLGLVERKGTPGQTERVLKETSAWLASHPDDSSVRTAYLGLVERKGTPGQTERVLKETSAWLASHPDDNYVRTAYLGLVERKGTPGQTERVLKETSAWLASHPDDSSVRTAYLGLVERYSSERDQARVIHDTSAWLASHPDDNYVRRAYLGLVERKGTPGQTERVLKETSAWLASHPDDSSVRTAYLGLVERKGTPGQTERVLKETSAWLASHPDDNYVRTAYLGLVERKGTPGQTERVLKETSAWLASHPDDSSVRTAYLGLVERYSSERDQARVIHDTSAWLASHPDDNYVRTAYLGLVERKGTPGQTERVLKETPTWLHAHPNATDVWTRFISYLIASERFDDARALAEEIISIHSRNSNVVTHYLHLMQNHLEEERTRELYGSLIKLFPRDIVIRSVWARWLTTVNSGEEAEKVFKALIAEHPKSFDPHYGYGRLLLDMERYGEAADQFRQVLKIHPGHAMAHDGLAAALQGLGRRAEGLHDDSEAARLFTAAEREFKSAIYWAGVAQDRQAIFFTHLGWFYVDRKRWSDALAAFDQAAKEDPEYFGNYWGKGRAFVGLGQWRDALHALQTTLEKAPNTLGPPASDDISQLIERCELALTTDP